MKDFFGIVHTDFRGMVFTSKSLALAFTLGPVLDLENQVFVNINAWVTKESVRLRC